MPDAKRIKDLLVANSERPEGVEPEMLDVSLLVDDFLGKRTPELAEAVELDGEPTLFLILEARPHLLRLTPEPDGQVSLEIRYLGSLVKEKLTSGGMRLWFGHDRLADTLELSGQTDGLKQTRDLLTPRPETPLGTSSLGMSS